MTHFIRCSPLLACLFLSVSLQADPGPLSIWYTTPGTPGNNTSWYQEALPVGNGKLGAMIYGGVGTEQIQFNEDTVWEGQPHDYSNPNASLSHLNQLQTDCFNHTSDSTFLSEATSYLMGVPIREAAYEPAGILNLTFPHSGTLNYLRTLDLTTATVNVRYDYNGVTYNRDIFASAPSNHVIVINLTASQPGSINFTCSFSTLQTATYSVVGNNLVMHAGVSGVSDSRYFATGLTNLVKYDARLRVIASGGTVTPGSTSITVANADSVMLLLSVASNGKAYNDLTADYVTTCSNYIANAAAVGYAALRQAQTNDYEALFNRVVLDLGTDSRTNQPVGYRKKQMSIDGADPQLVTLDFQLGRYLVISGSRPGSQPLNLQGKWNNLVAPSWDCKMTLNINEEMNYWGAEECNLSECTLPLFDMMDDLAKSGNAVALDTYFVTNNCSFATNAWVVHHNTDMWRDAAPCNGNDGIWPSGAAWLCQNVWWHFLYTGDTNWLQTNGFPLMLGAARFFEGFLRQDPAYPNWMVTCPSYSPEHDEGSPISVANVPSPTMDNELCRDLFTHVLAASQVLGTNLPDVTNITVLLGELPPDQIGSGGQLQEWLEDVDATYDSGHRHCSHLVGLYPGDEISTYYTPALAAAAKHSVDLRGYANSALTPWSCAWRMCLRDRLQDGDGAWTNLLFLYGYNKVATNLIFADAANEQLDCVFGRLAGIAGMFLQSARDEIILLPALPTQLTNGMVSGLCGQGGFEVDNLTWTNGQFTGATILSKAGNVCRLRSRWPIDVKLGADYVDAPMVLPGLYEFPTTAGSNYTIVPANIAEVENLPATFSVGDTARIVTNAVFSNLRGSQLTANAAGDFVSYTVSNLMAGTYHIRIGADEGADRGQFQLSCGPVGGGLANVGPVQDTYSPTNMAYLLPIHLTTPTNMIVLWTNDLQELDCGTWQAPTNGNYRFNFSVAGRNAASSGYNLVFDYIKFTPASAPSSPTLTVTREGDNVVISWPASATGYSLEYTTDFSNWNPVLQSPTVIGDVNVVTNATDGNTVFYRLQK